VRTAARGEPPANVNHSLAIELAHLGMEEWSSALRALGGGYDRGELRLANTPRLEGPSRCEPSAVDAYSTSTTEPLNMFIPHANDASTFFAGVKSMSTG